MSEGQDDPGTLASLWTLAATPDHPGPEETPVNDYHETGVDAPSPSDVSDPIRGARPTQEDA